MKNETKLMNCPFCGGEVRLQIVEFDAFRSVCSFLCDDCDFEMTYPYSNEEEAIKAFNTRKPMERILEKLDKRIEHHVKLVNYEMNMGTIVDVERHEEAIKATDKAIEIVKEEGGGE